MTGRKGTGKRWRAAAMVAGLAVGASSGAVPSAHARHHAARPAGAPAASPAGASQLVQQGVMALVSRDFAAAYRALAAAYRLQPSADILYQLGVTANSSGEGVFAQDLMRRYLAEAGPQGDPARLAEAQRIATRPRPPSGEVSVVGPSGAFVLVDDRLVGRLPLPRPLLLAAGAHVLTLDRAGALVPGRLELRNGQSLEARLPDDGTALQVRSLPTVYISAAGTDADADADAVRGALSAAGLSAFDTAAHSGELPPPECARERACLLRWAAAQGVPYALELQTTASPCELRASLIDVAIGEAASTRSAPCAGGPEPTLRELLPSLLREGLARPRGVLQVSSQPAGAEVLVAGSSLGKTPLVRPRFAAPLTLQVELPGFTPTRRQVEIRADATTPVELELVALPQVLPKVVVWERHRPRWRIALGITGLSVGAGLVGLGGSALAVDGSCVEEAVAPSLACQQRYATGTAGLALVVPGALLIGAGILALALPGPRRPVARAAPLAAAGNVAGSQAEAGGL